MARFSHHGWESYDGGNVFGTGCFHNCFLLRRGFGSVDRDEDNYEDEGYGDVIGVHRR